MDLRRNNSRNRVNTEIELQIVNQQFRNVVHIGRPIPVITNIQFLLYKLLYHKYIWHIFTFSIFFIFRILFGSTISLHEWYNDSLFFVITNNYLYKRLHWNNNMQKYFDNKDIKCYGSFFIGLTGITLFTIYFPSFYFTKNKVFLYNDHESIVFCIICIYVFITQMLSIKNMYCSTNHYMFRKHIAKYLFLLLYICIEIMCKWIYQVMSIDNSMFFIYNKYHFHHWMFGMYLLIFTELQQHYHTILQYIHYAIYLHGVACYGYDSLLM